MRTELPPALELAGTEWRTRRSERQPASGVLSSQNARLRRKAGLGESERPNPRPGDGRPEARRDRDRILYSSAFARLGGVTQVITPSPVGRLTHNRMTHTLKVAQLARSISELLSHPGSKHREVIDGVGGIDADVAEAAALAHDLGHPPFGHIGEQALDNVARSSGLRSGFEGNAQSFRIVTVLEAHDLEGIGLRLTYGTLAAVLKYPWTKHFGELPEGVPVSDPFRVPFANLTREKYGCYARLGSDVEVDESWETFRQTYALIPRDEYDRPLQTVEAAIMDLADDITYALHDLDDFFQAGLISTAAISDIFDAWRLEARSNLALVADGKVQAAFSPLARILEEHARALEEKYPQRFHREEMLDALDDFQPYLTALPDDQAASFERTMNMQNMISELITRFQKNLEVGPTFRRDYPFVRLAPKDWHIVESLKVVTRNFVIRRPGLAAVQFGQKKLLTELADDVGAWLRTDRKRVPSALKRSLEAADERGIGADQAKARAVLDYVAGLSDLQAVELHRVLRGGHLDLAGALVH